MKGDGMGLLPACRFAARFFGKRFFVLVFGMAGLSAGSAVFADDFKDGMALHGRGRYEEAFPLIKKAAEAGDAEAEYRLSSMYWHGRGVDADYGLAFAWCRRAAFQDHMKAAYALSDMYKTGVVEKDLQQAYYWFRQAAELDMENGRLSMALMYYRGTLTDKDMDKALVWFHQAAEEGNVTALTMLGIMYENGEHVEKDEMRALALFTEAAGKNVDQLTYRDSALRSRSQAQYHLGRMIEEGRGVQADPAVAMAWYEKAAADGNQAAAARLEEMARPEPE